MGEHARKGTCVDILGRYPDGSYEVLIQKIRIYDILSDEKGYIRDRDGFYTNDRVDGMSSDTRKCASYRLP